MHYPRHHKGGSILIVGLWMLFFLGALAVAVGVVVGARVDMARRLDLRWQGYWSAKAGVARAVAVLGSDTNDWDSFGDVWCNNSATFSNLLDGKNGYVLLAVRGTSAGGSVTNLGLSDEMARMDINSARVEQLAGLLEVVGGLGSAQARLLADHIDRTRRAERRRPASSVREERGGRVQGAFGSVHELLLVEGMGRGVFDRIRDCVTVYGGSRVNLNTAEAGVLLATARATDAEEKGGNSTAQSLVRKVLKFRENGGMFTSIVGPRLVGSMGQEAELTAQEAQVLQRMSPYLTVSSDCFRGRSVGIRRGVSQPLRIIEFVWNRQQEKMVFWNER